MPGSDNVFLFFFQVRIHSSLPGLDNVNELDGAEVFVDGQYCGEIPYRYQENQAKQNAQIPYPEAIFFFFPISVNVKRYNWKVRFFRSARWILETLAECYL